MKSKGHRIMKICFATWELNGVTPGGIGTVIGNFLQFYSDIPEAEFHILWYGDPGKLQRAASLYSGVTFHCVDALARAWIQQFYSSTESRGLHCEKVIGSPNAEDQAISIMLSLKKLEQDGVHFDVLEFPDFCGPAYATIMERTLKNINCIDTLSVRIHSTETALRGWDHRPFTANNSVRFELEKFCLKNCDLVVSHIPSVTLSVKETFGLPDNWLSSVRHETPPVLLHGDCSPPSDVAKNRNLVFSSKFQWFKRPDKFIRGAVRFMADHPEYRGKAVLSALVVSEELEQYCRALIPEDLQTRFVFERKLSSAERNRLIADSVCVFTSDYESFCLAAYEASLLGAVIVLNKENPGFDDTTPWVHAKNCIKYSGGVNELLEALKTAVFSEIDLKPNLPSVSKEPGYVTHLPSVKSAVTSTEKDCVSEVSIVVIVEPEYSGVSLFLPGFDPRHLNTKDIIFVYADGSKSQSLVDDAQKNLATNTELGSYVRFIDAGAAAPLGEMINRGIAEAKSEYCLVQNAGTVTEPEFCRMVGKLSSDDGVELVLPQVEHFNPSNGNYEVVRRIKDISLPTMIKFPTLKHLEFAINRAFSVDHPFCEDMDEFTLTEQIMKAGVASRHIVLTQSTGFTVVDDSFQRHGRRIHLDMVLARIWDLSFLGQRALVHVLDFGVELRSSGTSDAGIGLIKMSERGFLHRIENENSHWLSVAVRHPLKIDYWIPLRFAQKNPKKFRQSLKVIQSSGTDWKKVRWRHPLSPSKWMIAKELERERVNN